MSGLLCLRNFPPLVALLYLSPNQLKSFSPVCSGLINVSHDVFVLVSFLGRVASLSTSARCSMLQMFRGLFTSWSVSHIGLPCTNSCFYVVCIFDTCISCHSVGVVICLERGADLHLAQLMPLPLTVSCFSKIQIGSTFLVPAHLGSPEKGPLNVCVCVCVSAVTAGMVRQHHAEVNAQYSKLVKLIGRTELTILPTVDFRLTAVASLLC